MTHTWHPYGSDAVLLEFTDPHQRWAATCPLADEVVVGASTVLLRFDVRRYRHEHVVAAVSLGSHVASTAAEHAIPVTYDGPDLAVVADRSEISIAELIRRHTEATYRAEFCGFAPGFAYLSGLDPAMHTARRASPRARVPRGSVAVAGPYCAIYPTDSPGGWQLIGRTEAILFDPAAPHPATVRPGDTVRFEVVR